MHRCAHPHRPRHIQVPAHTIRDQKQTFWSAKPPNPLQGQGQGCVREHAHTNPDEKTVWCVCTIARDSWKLHGQANDEPKSRVPKHAVVLCAMMQKMQKMQKIETAKRACSNFIQNEVYCNVCVRVRSAFTPILVSKNSAVTAPNQGSVKPCFCLPPDSNEKCSLGKKCHAHFMSGCKNASPEDTYPIAKVDNQC